MGTMMMMMMMMEVLLLLTAIVFSLLFKLIALPRAFRARKSTRVGCLVSNEWIELNGCPVCVGGGGGDRPASNASWIGLNWIRPIRLLVCVHLGPVRDFAPTNEACKVEKRFISSSWRSQYKIGRIYTSRNQVQNFCGSRTKGWCACCTRQMDGIIIGEIIRSKSGTSKRQTRTTVEWLAPAAPSMAMVSITMYTCLRCSVLCVPPLL